MANRRRPRSRLHAVMRWGLLALLILLILLTLLVPVLVLLAHFIQQTETVSMGHICRRKPLPLIQIEDCGIRIQLFMKSQK